jgi:ATP-dependent DNA helicase RecG
VGPYSPPAGRRRPDQIAGVPAAPPPRHPWDVDVSTVRGVGPARARQLAQLGIRTVGDLLRRVPRRHEDRSAVTPVGTLRPGEGVAATVRGTVVAVREGSQRRGLHLLRAEVADGTGRLRAVWFNQPHLRSSVRRGADVYLTGRVDVDPRGGGLVMSAPEIEVAESRSGRDPLHAGRIVPVYPLGGGVGQRGFRTLQKAAVDAFAPLAPEPLPGDLRRRLGLVAAGTAWSQIHFPPDAASLRRARRRLVFEELLLLQLALGLRRRRLTGRARPFDYAPPGPLSAAFRDTLPFRLTDGQQRVLAEIESDLRGPRPMRRLLQGDVGSGKTAVAVAALLRAVESGRQGALMAPTEVLAEQHYLTLRRQLEPLGVSVALLAGGLDRAGRRAAAAAIADGSAHIAVGTHALVQGSVAFRALGLAVADEQHRFGVRQRDSLAAKGDRPDMLVMTATPIPRTLALTVCGDLDVSVVDGLPPGRRPVRTFLRRPEGRDRVYAFVRDQVRSGRQAYVICPVIDGGEGRGAGAGSAKRAAAAVGRPAAAGRRAGGGGGSKEGRAAEQVAATAWYRRLQEALPDVSVALLHGRLPAAEKDGVMQGFAGGAVQVLVATTVVEVGLDVPNATVMVVEGAERFGLAQLHQLRGRVGRGPHPSFCILISGDDSADADARLRLLVSTADGFALAEADLRLRGPGEVLGTRQHGMPDLVLADLARDLRVLEEARREAQTLLEADPELEAPRNRVLRAGMETALRDWGGVGST